MPKTEIVIEIDAHLLEQARAAKLPLDAIAETALKIALAAIDQGQDWREAIATYPWAELRALGA